MNIKSERLKKLEIELGDLERWLILDLVPKKDLQKHKEEIKILRDKIEEEKSRLRFLKESGEMEEFALPKKPTHPRQAFQETHSLPDIDIGEEGMTDMDLDMETESFDADSTTAEETLEHDEEYPPEEGEEEDEEDPFSDRNRWKRGILEDPELNDW
ncbi:MAG: hypothetical protein FJZ58_00840 [Chlamydiae bacterium]|nr:hypothetical protein [Chlamydiota bacterium]